jgi:hypothetical protein
VGLADGISGWLIVVVSGDGGSVCLTGYIRRVTLPFCRHVEFILVYRVDVLPFCRHAEFISVSGVC